MPSTFLVTNPHVFRRSAFGLVCATHTLVVNPYAHGVRVRRRFSLFEEVVLYKWPAGLILAFPGVLGTTIDMLGMRSLAWKSVFAGKPPPRMLG